MTDPLSDMRSQVDAAYAAADRLVREADTAARERAGVPPRGFEGERTEAEGTAFGELQALAGLIETARARCRRSSHASSRGAARPAAALRALIDWWIARLEREREPPVEVQDIPID